MNAKTKLAQHVVNMYAEVGGFITVEKAKCDTDGNEIPGTRHVAVPTFMNMVTDSGLDAKGTAIMSLNCVVGTSNVPIAEGTTTLGNGVAVQNTIVETTYGVNTAVTDMYGWRRGVYRFSAGTATGNLTEVALTSSGNTPSSPIFCGSLFKDNLGNPIVVSKQSDELLDVTYEVRMYAKITDDTYVVTVNGVDHTFTTRACMAGLQDSVNYTPSRRIYNPTVEWGHNIAHPTGAGWNAVFFRDTTLATLGGIPANPGGTWIGYAGGESGGFTGVTVTFATYVPGSYSRECTVLVDGTKFNHVNGIACIVLSSGIGLYKTHISPVLPKVVGVNLLITYRWFWGRYTGPG